MSPDLLPVLLVLRLFGELSASGGWTINPKGPTFQRTVSQCIEEIAIRHFRVPRLLGMTATYNMSSPTAEIEQLVFKALHNQSRWPIQILGTDDDKPKKARRIALKSVKKIPLHLDFPTKRKNGHNVIIVDSYAEFNRQVKQITETPSFNPSAHYLVYCAEDGNVTAVRRALHILWDNFCVNAILITPTGDIGTLNIYTIYGYNPAPICGTNITVELLARCENGVLQPQNIKIYPDRVPKDSSNCTMPAVAMKWPPFVIDVDDQVFPGIEVLALRSVGDHLNFRINFTQSSKPWGKRDANGTWQGLLAEIQSRRAVFGLGNIYSNQMIYEDFYISVPYYFARLAWFVPVAEVLPRWQNLVSIFSLSLWISVICTLLISALAWYCLARKGSYDMSLRSFGVCVLNGLCIIFGLANATRPIGSLLRVSFIMIGVFGIHINALYQAALMKVFTDPPRAHQISNIPEMIRSGFKIGGFRSFREFYNESGEPLSEIIYANYTTYESNETVAYYLGLVSSTKHFATIANRLFVNYYISINDPIVSDEAGAPKIYGFAHDIVTYSTNMVTIRGFPYIYRINELIHHFLQNGMLEKWNADIRVALKRSAARAKQKNPEIKLSVEHLQGAFVVLLFGMIIGFISFLIEVISKLSFVQYLISEINIRSPNVCTDKHNLNKKSSPFHTSKSLIFSTERNVSTPARNRRNRRTITDILHRRYPFRH